MVDFFITGGFLRIHKTAFAQELFIQKGILRALLNCRSAGDLSVRQPSVNDAGTDGMITIHFNNTEPVRLGDDPGELLGALKKKYREKVMGRVSCKGWMSTFTISLDSEDGEIQFIM